jgi:succinyl-diaminopimelate desuccinylase
VRFNDGWTPQTLEAALRERLANVPAGGATVALSVLPGASNAFLSPQSGAVETLCAVIEADCGARPQLSTAGGTSDARFVAQYCPVVECGLPGPTMHKADESVTIADVAALRDLYAAFLRRFFGAVA